MGFLVALGVNPPSAPAGSPLVWLRSDLGLIDGASVSTWTDRTGNGWSPTGANPATFHTAGGPGGLPRLTGNGTTTFLQKSITGFVQPAEVFLVAKWDTAFSATSTIIDGLGNTMRLFRTSSTGVEMFAGSALTGTISANMTAWSIYDMQWTTTSSLVCAGASIMSGSAGTGAPGALSLFAFGAGNTDWAAASIAEVIVYASVLSSADRLTTNKYLEARYGLTGP